jgi:hypothetical protein
MCVPTAPPLIDSRLYRWSNDIAHSSYVEYAMQENSRPAVVYSTLLDSGDNLFSYLSTPTHMDEGGASWAVTRVDEALSATFMFSDADIDMLEDTERITFNAAREADGGRQGLLAHSSDNSFAVLAGGLSAVSSHEFLFGSDQGDVTSFAMRVLSRGKYPSIVPSTLDGAIQFNFQDYSDLELGQRVIGIDDYSTFRMSNDRLRALVDESGGRISRLLAKNPADHRRENLERNGTTRPLRHVQDLNPAQAEEMRARRRVANLTDQQRARRSKRAPRVLPVEQVWSHKCPHCSCWHLGSASSAHKRSCCQDGKLLYDHPLPLRPLPLFIVRHIEGRTAHMSRSSAAYNNTLAMCSTIVDNSRGGGFERGMRGPHCVKINGNIVHRFPPSRSVSDPSGGLAYFMYNPDIAVPALASHARRLNSGSTEGAEGYNIVDEALLKDLQSWMVVNNPYAQELRSIGNIIENSETLEQARVQIDGSTEFFEVAHISSERPNGARSIFTVRFAGETEILGLDSSRVEPYSHPLLFLHGGEGWGAAVVRKRIGFFPYLRSRILMPDTVNTQGNPLFSLPSPVLCKEHLIAQYHEPTESSISEAMCTMNPLVHIPTNRFQVFARAGQQYMVDQVSRAVDRVLDYLRKNQTSFFAGKQRDLRRIEHGDANGGDMDINSPEGDDDGHDDGNGDPNYLPASLFGSPRYLRNRAVNALSLVSEFGGATGFLTITCNPNWREIQVRLFQGQTAFDRPDVVCAVFHQRKAAFLENLRNGHYFTFAERPKVVYIIHVIEFQHRGLPHAHIVFRLSNHPSHENELSLAAYCDQFVCAERPVVTPTSTQQEHRYRQLVEDHMVHRCCVASNGCQKEPEGRCKRGYPASTASFVPALQTMFSEHGFPIYRRRTEADCYIVPHNREMLLAWDGHANLEFATTTKCLLYLYKYLYKGPKKVCTFVFNYRTLA